MAKTAVLIITDYYCLIVERIEIGKKRFTHLYHQSFMVQYTHTHTHTMIAYLLLFMARHALDNRFHVQLAAGLQQLVQSHCNFDTLTTFTSTADHRKSLILTLKPPT